MNHKVPLTYQTIVWQTFESACPCVFAYLTGVTKLGVPPAAIVEMPVTNVSQKKSCLEIFKFQKSTENSITAQVNDILGVSDLATSTLAQGAASTEAGLTTTQAAIDGLVAKINEILKKSTLSC